MSKYEALRDQMQQEGPPEDCHHGVPEDICDREGMCRIERLEKENRDLDDENERLWHAGLPALEELGKRIEAEWSEYVGGSVRRYILTSGRVLDLHGRGEEMGARAWRELFNAVAAGNDCPISHEGEHLPCRICGWEPEGGDDGE